MALSDDAPERSCSASPSSLGGRLGLAAAGGARGRVAGAVAAASDRAGAGAHRARRWSARSRPACRSPCRAAGGSSGARRSAAPTSSSRCPVSTTTRLRIGSVSKPLTAAALGLLVEEGRLDLDAPVQRYVPDFPKKAWPITTRQLAGHLAGHPPLRAGRVREPRRTTTRCARASSIFEKDALLFEPGHEVLLLVLRLEPDLGRPRGRERRAFLDLMQKRVFGAGRDDAHVPGRPGADRARAAAASTRATRDAGAIVNAGLRRQQLKWAGGGFLSTAEDLVAFGNALLEGRLLKPETLRLLWTSQKTVGRQGHGYGMGWAVDRDAKGRRRVRALGRRAGRHREPRDLSGRARSSSP